MSYTTLRVVETGIWLYEEHAKRLGPNPKIQYAFEAFAAAATPGIYALTAKGDQLDVSARDRSMLFDLIPLTYATSPVLNRNGLFEKRVSPCEYDAVRQAGIATLLTSADGNEIYEASVASVLAWDGTSLVAVPTDRPRTASTAEAWITRHFKFRRSPLLRSERWPLALINAVYGVCVPANETTAEFPTSIIEALRRSIADSARKCHMNSQSF